MWETNKLKSIEKWKKIIEKWKKNYALKENGYSFQSLIFLVKLEILVSEQIFSMNSPQLESIKLIEEEDIPLS